MTTVEEKVERCLNKINSVLDRLTECESLQNLKTFIQPVKRRIDIMEQKIMEQHDYFELNTNEVVKRVVAAIKEEQVGRKLFEDKMRQEKEELDSKDVNQVKETQSDLNNFINKYIGKDNMTIEDAAGYHKSLFTAMNADAIAKHFYEQGKADAVKGQIAKDKNVNIKPRQQHGEVQAGGMKVKVLGESANDFKFKIKNKK